MMPEPQERSTTPEIATISVQDSDTRTTVSSQENDCAAPPSSPADNLTFDRTNRHVLHGKVRPEEDRLDPAIMVCIFLAGFSKFTQMLRNQSLPDPQRNPIYP